MFSIILIVKLIVPLTDKVENDPLSFKLNPSQRHLNQTLDWWNVNYIV